MFTARNCFKNAFLELAIQLKIRAGGDIFFVSLFINSGHLEFFRMPSQVHVFLYTVRAGSQSRL